MSRSGHDHRPHQSRSRGLLTIWQQHGFQAIRPNNFSLASAVSIVAQCMIAGAWRHPRFKPWFVHSFIPSKAYICSKLVMPSETEDAAKVGHAVKQSREQFITPFWVLFGQANADDEADNLELKCSHGVPYLTNKKVIKDGQRMVWRAPTPPQPEVAVPKAKAKSLPVVKGKSMPAAKAKVETKASVEPATKKQRIA